MPLLTALGLAPHRAVAAALFQSIFIALPAALSYSFAVDKLDGGLLLMLLLVHGLGVWLGASSSRRIPARQLKWTVACLAIVLALWKLLGLLR